MRARGVALITAILVEFAVSIPLRGQQSLFVPANDVSFSIATDRSSYSIGDAIELSYAVKNISHAALLVPRGVWDLDCPGSPHVWAGLEDESGKHFSPGYLISCLGPPHSPLPERLKKDTVLLQPGEVYHSTFTLETNTFRTDLMPGNYRVEATLSGWRGDRFSHEDRNQLSKMHARLLQGDIPGSATIQLRRQ